MPPDAECPSRRNVRPSAACPIDGVAIGRYLVRMRSVGIKVLNSKLSEYVRLAASGETILVTDRDQVVAELGPLRETRSPILADAFLAEAVRSGVLTPPRLAASVPPPKPAPRRHARRNPGRSGREPARPVIYIDTSVALAHLLAEDRQPPASLWEETLFSSRLLEYEIWTPLHARGLAEAYGVAASRLIGQVAMLELSPSVLARALDAFPGPGSVRTLDALHLASCAYLAEHGQGVRLASYDQRMNAVARAMDIALFELEASRIA